MPAPPALACHLCRYISETPISGSMPDSWAGVDAFPSLVDLCVGLLLGSTVSEPALCMAACCPELVAAHTSCPLIPDAR